MKYIYLIIFIICLIVFSTLSQYDDPYILRKVCITSSITIFSIVGFFYESYKSENKN